MKTLHHHWRLANAALAIAALCYPGALHAQGPLQISTIQVTPGQPVQFTFTDSGTGATNYLVEFSSSIGSEAAWSNLVSAAITPLGQGNFRVQIPNPQTSAGFLRVRGYGGAAGIVSASFNTTAFQVTEGAMVSPTITFTAPYYGIVRYTISGTAASGDYVNLTGTIFVNGVTASIPVTFLDNQNIGQLRHLTLALEAGPGLSLGASSQTTITIDENDAEWQGAFSAGGAILGFVLKIQESNEVKIASLKSDGFGFFPTNEIPASLLFTNGQFTAAAANIALPAAATLLNEPLRLTLFLSAMNGLTNQTVSATQVTGVGALITEVPAKPFLNMTNFGAFQLLKPPVQPSTNQVELANLP